MAQTAPVLNQTASVNNGAGPITIPAGTLIGDMMVLAYVSLPGSSGGVPTGWTQVLNQVFNSTANAYATVCTRRAVAGDPGSTVTLPGGSNPAMAAQLSTWSNVGSDAVVVGTDASTTIANNGSNPATVTAPALTTADPNCTVVAVFFGAGAASPTHPIPQLSIPATASQPATVGSGGPNSEQWGVGVSYQTYTAAGTSTSETATWTPGNNVGSTTAGVCGIQIALPPIYPPSAPTLTGPANAVYEDLSGTPTFTWTPNPTTGDGPQNAIAFRQKLSGVGSYSYWNNGSSTWQSTLVYFPQTTNSYTFPTNAWANGNIYNWSVSTQEAAESLQSPFASDFTVTGQAPPSAVISAPTGTIQTTTPTVTAAATVAAGASLTGYRVVVYTAAQVAAGGFQPGVTTGVYDSGTVSASSTAISQPVTGLANNTTYTAYVQITETGGETGVWASQAFTVSFDAPAVPTVAVTPSIDVSGQPTLVVGVQCHDNLMSAASASMEGGLGTWSAGANTTVADSTAQALDGSQSMSLTAAAAGSVTASTGWTTHPVIAGASYTVLASFRAAASARSATVATNWYTAAGMLIASSNTSAAVADTTTGWTQAAVTATAPPAAAYTSAAVTVAGSAASEVHYADAAGIFPGTVTTWTRGGLVGSTTVDIWARTAASSPVTDPQRPYPAGVRLAAGLTLNAAQQTTWTDRAAASGCVYEYQAVVVAGGGITTPSAWTA
jgi:hypothetical protein